jgi:hypothetical protein
VIAPQPITVFSVIVLLLPMFYLLLASPAFLFVRLDIPEVARLLRAMFYGYFVATIVAGLFGSALVALDHHAVPALALALVVATTFAWRRWFMARLDMLLIEREAGASGVADRLRWLHVAGMLVNAMQLLAVIAIVPSLVMMA